MKNKFTLGSGTVQPFIYRDTPFYMYFFGPVEYDKNKPVISEWVRKEALPIIEKLNANEITTQEAEKLLDKIHY